ncbi:HORMA domain-containing protein 2 isoform X6 [Acinonyx jubatus]|uniref:HORMA domain-containing protein 2 isoform X6 n=1 Tax=Acinonyx jubatus TaxID=32536 RepID=A0ABM3NR00_ACIJB|nr:HORMA domain-containing protein 2 isoform X6 [Acinonyx jubatus]
MATAQLSRSIKIHKASKETVFPSQITNEHASLIMVKKLFATSISCITYLRGLFPESSYGERHLDDLSLKILREDKKCPGSLHIIKWIQGCFDALEKRYLHMAVLTLYTNPKEPEKVTEIYQFKFKYTKQGATMDFDSSSTSFESGTNSEDVKKASVLLIRKLYILMQNLGPLPNDVILTMKLHYYNAVTPHDYQPPGFKEGENSTTEITHQGLDFDEEEEECSNHRAQHSICSFPEAMERKHRLRDCFDQIQRMNFVCSQQSSQSSRKKRKVSEPVKVFIPDRK